ncbi:hypothetical protein [Legionella sp. km772]|uniref:hypothetical protein n=1 Tax=Legionella sp. km772 TaxID=2498111 RepID=UPI000F8DA510|nr:hypothetical protein [Legionella sp. km772]RUR04403.1 hypothetical protein ELY15_15550 [Legionella sp. km772]
MTKLVKLLNSLISTLRANHDIHAKNGPSLRYDTENLETLEATLETMIEKSTESYKDRIHFLAYLKHEALFIKDLLLRKTAFTPDELIKCKKELSTLLIDLRELLKTLKTANYRVSYSDLAEESLKIDLKGLSNGYYFCASGTMVNNEIMTPLGLSYTSSNGTITSIVNDICEEHQIKLLGDENPKLRVQLEQERAKVLELEATRQKEKETLELALTQERLKQQELEATSQREKAALELALTQERLKQQELEATSQREKAALEFALTQERLKQQELEATNQREKEALELALAQERLKQQKLEATKQKEIEALKLLLTQEKAKLVELGESSKSDKEALERQLELLRAKIVELEEAVRVKPSEALSVSESEELSAAKIKIAELLMLRTVNFKLPYF